MEEASGNIAGGVTGMLNVFVDPAAAAKGASSKLAWLWPVLLLLIGMTVFGILMAPYTAELMDVSLRQRNVPPEQMEQARSMTQIIGKITIFLTAPFVVGLIALFALLVKVVYSMMEIRPRFREVFTLMACCSLIIMLQSFALYVVLRVKGDPITSQDQMQPAFGLDVFFPDLHGPLHAILNFFSVFELWYLAVLIFGLSALTRSTKTQAILASTPAWLIPLAIAMVASLFRPNA